MLTERSIRRFRGRLLAIEPFRETSVTGVGYDLTVGLFAHVRPSDRKILRVIAIDEVETNTSKGLQVTTISDSGSDVQTVDKEPTITLDRGTYGIVISREYVHLSSKLAGTFHSKSSLAARAVYLNSTTCDPNWKGRLIFSLYNASGVDVPLDLDMTFATLCIYRVHAASRETPKKPRTVLENYLADLHGTTTQTGRIFSYIDSDERWKPTFDRAVERVRRWASFPRWLFYFFSTTIATWRLITNNSFLFLSISLVAAAIAVSFIPAVATNTRLDFLAKAIALVAAILTLFAAYRRATRS